jgi:hypothetical protein
LKKQQRLDYSGLAEALGQRGMVDPQRLRLALQASAQGPTTFCETLVVDGLVGDWELSRVVCDLYGLPFMPVDIYAPDPAAMDGLDLAFLLNHRLVPVSRHGKLLSVTMPALVPAEVLGHLSELAQLHVLPLVGTVSTNNSWLEQNLQVDDPAPAIPSSDGGEGGDADDWSSLFDEGDAAVLLDLQSEPDTDPD